MSQRPKERLGKGLGALLGDYMTTEPPKGDVLRVALSSVVPNPQQPRRSFSEAELAELAASIDQNGLLQPLLVRPAPGLEDRYELVAGERRLRAVASLGWHDVPVVVRAVDDDTLLVLALVENLQREALGPMEEAQGYRSLADQYGLTQDEIARSVGKDRSTVANMLRLLRLPVSVRNLVEQGRLSVGHARALLAIEDPLRMADVARSAVRAGWSVREIERRVKKLIQAATTVAASKKASSDPILQALEEELCSVLATRVRIRTTNKKDGVIEVPFHNPEDFERIFELMAGREASEIVG
ncbi:MAG: ParB/RepB/Spo0J family partition protein [Gemmatimonadota bacterium]|nr:MAG: ParB/RepB/Spo0J family partition protein [Gemmatimonadota bacterium]